MLELKKETVIVDILWAIIVFIGTFVISLFGFSQIVGSVKVSIKQKKLRDFIECFNGSLVPLKSTVFTLIIWLLILGFVCLAIHMWINEYRLSYYIATGIGFLFSLKSGSNINDIAEATHMQMPESSFGNKYDEH